MSDAKQKLQRGGRGGAAAVTSDAVESAVAAAVEAAATRGRLLDAAGAVFADVGYERAHVRAICARAGANVAAIKYHFGGKYELYQAVFAHGKELDHLRLSDESAARAGDVAGDGADGDARLRAFVGAFVGHLMDPNRPTWLARVMAREMVEPTGVLDQMVEQHMRPTVDHLRRIVRRMVGPRCPTVTVERAMLSVIGQCVFYVHSRPVLERIFPHHVGRPDVAAIAAHVAEFSVAGVHAICRAHAAPRGATPRAAKPRKGRA